jgi:proteasome alpha subunit
VAVLDRTRPQQRKFKRILGGQLERLLGGGEAAAAGENGGSAES